MSDVKVSVPTVTMTRDDWVFSTAVSSEAAVKVDVGFNIDGEATDSVQHTTVAGSSTPVEYRCPPKSSFISVTAWARRVEGDGSSILRVSEPLSADPQTRDDAPPPAQGPDPRDLVWSSKFAALTGVVLVLLLGGLVIGLAEVWDRRVGKVTQPSRIAEMVVFLGSVAGAGAILVGAWVVLLEMRGRAPRTPGDAPHTIRVAADETGGVGDVVESLSKFRGPLLLVVVGALLIAAMAVVGRDVARDQLPERAPATTTTTP